MVTEDVDSQLTTDSKSKVNRRPPVALLFIITVLFALYGFIQIRLTTAWGAGLFPDSVAYLSGARSILTNGNLNGLGSHWPPLYPMMIALSGLFADDIFSSLRWLQIITYLACISTFILIIYHNTRSRLLSIAAGTLLCTSPTLLQVNTMAWSEGLFCLFTLLGFFLLSKSLVQKEDKILLFSSALLLGLSSLTRYAGIAGLLTAPLIILLFLEAAPLRRLTVALFYTFIGSFPLLVWLIRNLALGTNATNREILYHPISATKVATGLSVINTWFHIPGSGFIGIALLFFSICLLYLLSREQSLKGPDNHLLETSFIYVLVYIIFIIFSISFIDAQTPLSDRILIPAYLFLILGLTLLVQRMLLNQSLRCVGALFIAVMFVLALFQSGDQRTYVAKATESGIGWANKAWRTSSTLDWLRSQPPEIPIYTNAPEPITVYTNHSATRLPSHTNPHNRQANHQYETEMTAAMETIRREDGAIIYFDVAAYRWYFPTVQELTTYLHPAKFLKTNDAIIIKPTNK